MAAAGLVAVIIVGCLPFDWNGIVEQRSIELRPEIAGEASLTGKKALTGVTGSSPSAGASQAPDSAGHAASPSSKPSASGSSKNAQQTPSKAPARRR